MLPYNICKLMYIWTDVDVNAVAKMHMPPKTSIKYASRLTLTLILILFALVFFDRSDKDVPKRFNRSLLELWKKIILLRENRNEFYIYMILAYKLIH